MDCHGVTDIPGGWYDAGNENGEARAHGVFLSGMAHVLLERRAEMSTAEVQCILEAMEWGADYLLELGYWENVLRGQHHIAIDDPEPKTLPCTHFFHDAIAVRGHIWGEHHTRHHGMQYGKMEFDERNNHKRIYMSARGLIDTARALESFDPVLAQDYLFQLYYTREYLYTLHNYCPGDSGQLPAPPNTWVAHRAQAALDLACYDYDPTQAYLLEDARTKLCIDLFWRRPGASLSKLKTWLRTGHKLGFSAYPGAESLFQMIMRDQPECGSTIVQYREALAEIADLWYVQKSFQDPAANPLSIPIFWSSNATYAGFGGTCKRPTEELIREVYFISRLAQLLGKDPGSPQRYESLVELTVGALNWIFGMHTGVRGRYALPSSDDEFVGSSFVNGLGSLVTVQNTISDHYWQSPSLIAGAGGSGFSNFDERGPDLVPWSYPPHTS